VPAVTGANLASYTVTAVNGTLTVSSASTTTTLSAPATATSGSSVTLTATVASRGGAPGGSVAFYNGTTALALGRGTLNSSGVATLSTTTLPVGDDSVTAAYGAAGNFAGSNSAPVTLTVTAAPVVPPATYAMTANPTSLTVQEGQTATTTLTFTPTGGYRGTVALSCSSLPTNASCVFAQNQVTLNGNGQSVSLGLNITTTQVADRHAPQSPFNPTLFALAFWWPGGLTELAIFIRERILHKKRSSWHLCLLLVCAWGFAAGLSGCGSSSGMGSSSGTSTPPSTPAPAPAQSTSQITVVATGTSGTVVSTQTVTLSLEMTQ